MSDFDAYLKQNRLERLALTNSQDRALARYYVEWAGKIKKELPFILDKSTLTEKKLAMNSLLREAAKITNGFNKLLDKSLLEAANLSVEANKYMLKGYQQALFDKGASVNLQKVLFRIPEDAVKAIATRIWNDGLMLSDRLWILDRRTKRELERIVMEAIATGRPASDPLITKTIEGFLNPNYTGKYTTLHGRRVSYEASRLLRTERTAAFAEADRLSNEANPAVKGEILFNAEDPCEICEPLHEEPIEVSGRPPIHSNCRCTTIPLVEDIRKFTDRYLEFMKEPSSQPDLMAWAKEYMGKAA